jgi:glycosyltransferase involved in cell wall biosynthesis
MEPLVSICMITFRHQAFIRQAIEGVMMQQTSFPIELVIGEDLSDDGTRAICDEMAQQYGERIRLLPSDKNYGQNNNLHRTIQACTGKYIALCEGDDYWIDPCKLQKQVDFLENNNGYVMCFHLINTVAHNGTLLDEQQSLEQPVYYHGLDFFQTFVPTPSVVFRNCLLHFPDAFFRVKSTDAFIIAMLSGYGNGANLGFVGASYRQHDGGLYNRLSTLGKYKQAVHTRKLMKRSSYFNKDQQRRIGKELLRREILYIKIFLKKKELLNCCRMMLFCLWV